MNTNMTNKKMIMMNRNLKVRINAKFADSMDKWSAVILVPKYSIWTVLDLNRFPRVNGVV